MRIGVPKEIKNREFRAGLTPAGVRELVMHGHEVMVERDLGGGIRLTDDDYRQAGATVLDSPAAVFEAAELIVKVKEPQLPECAMLREGQLLFTYLHLAAAPEITTALMQSGATAIAYETITGPQNTLPLLAPMSEVAGRLSIQAGAHALERAQGGSGTLLGGVPGVAAAKVLIIGGGIVGDNAAYIAKGMGAEVTILDRSIPRLRQLDMDYAGRVSCVYSTRETIEHFALQADLVVGAVLVPGAAAPKLLSRDIISRMKAGSVVVDVAIDQGGCFETSHPTTHEDPTYLVDEVVHYCVANMPGAVPRTSTFALTNATLPYVVQLADRGLPEALGADPDLRNGLNVHAGRITCEPVAESLGHAYHDPTSLL